MAANGSGEISAHVTKANEARQTTIIDDLAERSRTVLKFSESDILGVLLFDSGMSIPSCRHKFVQPCLVITMAIFMSAASCVLRPLTTVGRNLELGNGNLLGINEIAPLRDRNRQTLPDWLFELGKVG